MPCARFLPAFSPVGPDLGGPLPISEGDLLCAFSSAIHSVGPALTQDPHL